MTRTPKGYVRLKTGATVHKGDRQSNDEGGWTTLAASHARFGLVGRYEIIIRRKRKSK